MLLEVLLEPFQEILFLFNWLSFQRIQKRVENKHELKTPINQCCSSWCCYNVCNQKCYFQMSLWSFLSMFMMIMSFIRIMSSDFVPKTSFLFLLWCQTNKKIISIHYTRPIKCLFFYLHKELCSHKRIIIIITRRRPLVLEVDVVVVVELHLLDHFLVVVVVVLLLLLLDQH